MEKTYQNSVRAVRVMGMRAMATLSLSTSSSPWHSANPGECNKDYGVLLPSASHPGLLHFVGRGRSSTFLLPSDSNLKRIYSRGAWERLETNLLQAALRQSIEVLLEEWLARRGSLLLGHQFNHRTEDPHQDSEAQRPEDQTLTAPASPRIELRNFAQMER